METTVDTKYYTPSLEEFHIGFEYEFKLYKDGITEWEPTTLNVCAVLTDFVADNPFAQRPSDFRVKYLDKEDIESLGFKQEGENYFVRRENELFGIWLNADHTINIHESTNGYEEKGYVPVVVSKISCKNKSKLKQLLKHVGVL